MSFSATKICAQVIPGMAQSVTDATKPEGINPYIQDPPFEIEGKSHFSGSPAAVSYAGTT